MTSPAGDTYSQTSPEAVALTVRRDGAVAILTLNRPGRLNAINDEIRLLLPRTLELLDDDETVRAIIVHGGGSRAFCVGADITEARAPETTIATRRRTTRFAWIDAFDKVTKPVIAAVHGFCLGGGLEIALACDIRMASPESEFGLPETGLGLIPGAGGTQRLHRLIGLGRALDLLMTGDRIDAAEAHRIGLISRLAADSASLLDEAIALAQKIAARGPAATLFVKEAAKSGSDLHLSAGMALERTLFSILAATKDRAEAAHAFREKRVPKFIGE